MCVVVTIWIPLLLNRYNTKILSITMHSSAVFTMSNDMNDVEKASPSELHNDHLKHSYAADGYLNDRSQASLPAVYRIFASTSPLGLLSFATGTSVIDGYQTQVEHGD